MSSSSFTIASRPFSIALDWRGDQVIITEEVVKAAAGTEGNGKEVMALLLDWRREETTASIKEKTSIAAATCGEDRVLNLLS
jgi:hypothetical protein